MASAAKERNSLSQFSARMAVHRPPMGRPARPDWRKGLKQVLPLSALVGNLPADLRDAWEERAAIMEYDGGLPRDDAERCAYRDVVGHDV